MAENKIVNIFWTAGWDSSYRLVELSRKDVIIQAVYCLDYSRPSISIELEHMEKILELLKKKSETKAKFLPIKTINITTLPQDEAIHQSWRIIRKEIALGTQYIYLAEVAKQFPGGGELGIGKPNGEFCGVSATIDRFGKLIHQNDTFFLDPTNTTPECYKIFGNMTFPIIQTTEVQMLKNIQAWGYEDVMKQIWFCYTPSGNETCGVCRPCQQKMECHMEFLLDKPAQQRYKIFRIISKITGRRIASKIIREFLRRKNNWLGR